MTTNSEQNLRPIHYLGSKLRMLDAISEAIDEIDPGGGTVCDLFAGSGTVSKHLAKTRDIVSVDVQNYSRVLCEASINKLSVDIDSNSVLEDIVNTNFSSIIQAACMPLNEYEATCLKTMKSDPGPSFEIIEKGSIYLFLNEPLSKMSSELQMAISETTHNISSINLIDSENTMILRYYGGLYFSYKQAMYLDIIAHYIFKQQGLLKTKLLAALLSTASEIVNTIGKQFAQPLKVRDKNGYYKESLSDKILSDRTINTISVFKKWMEFYLQTGEKHSVISITSNYTEAISQLKKLNVSVVYADPPYTRYHYSRYYHVLETICLRDNPKVTTTFPNGKGGLSRAIYREGRHQSPFCIKSQAEEAFRTLFAGVSQQTLPLIISYSPFDASKAVTPRLRTIEELVKMAKEYYSHVEIRSPGEFTHSKLNSSENNYEANHEAELLLICY